MWCRFRRAERCERRLGRSSELDDEGERVTERRARRPLPRRRLGLAEGARSARVLAGVARLRRWSRERERERSREREREVPLSGEEGAGRAMIWLFFDPLAEWREDGGGEGRSEAVFDERGGAKKPIDSSSVDMRFLSISLLRKRRQSAIVEGEPRPPRAALAAAAQPEVSTLAKDHLGLTGPGMEPAVCWRSRNR